MDRTKLQPLVDLGNNSVLGYEVLSDIKNMAAYPSALDVIKNIFIGHDDIAQFFINMTAKDAASENFAELFLDILNGSNINGKRIVLEVSEYTHPEHISKVKRNLSLLRSHGIKIALDDFGTQYSGLSFLKDLPVDIVKIDQNFVQEAPSSKKTRTLLTLCTKIFHDFDCRVVAEGIETIDQLECVKNASIDIGQGFLFTVLPKHPGQKSNPFIYAYEIAIYNPTINLVAINL
ncbi:MAG: EAL domain-containing protein [Holosporaceae bacterium]|nr:EAL domain-containing protein [Holosporaceae bacterium]